MWNSSWLIKHCASHSPFTKQRDEFVLLMFLHGVIFRRTLNSHVKKRPQRHESCAAHRRDPSHRIEAALRVKPVFGSTYVGIAATLD